jgi:SPOR domain
MIDSSARTAVPSLRDGKSATPARSGSVDPLAELARLIEQDETFGAIARNGGRSQQRGELSERREELPASNLDDGAPLVPSHLCDGPTGEPRDPHEQGEYDEPDYSHGLPNERRGLRVFAAAATGLALLGSASAMAYWAWSDGRVRSDETRVIAASVGPDKTVPSPQGENGRSESDQRTGTTTGEEKPADATPAAPQAPPPGSPAGTTQGPPTDAKEPGQTPPGATEPGVAQENRFVVQLSSQRSEAAAQTTSRTLQTKHPDLFGGRQPFIRRSDLGDRGVYYRVLMGPFSLGEAKELCGNLKKSNADCVVQRN